MSSHFDFPALSIDDTPDLRQSEFIALYRTIEKGSGILTIRQEWCLLAVCFAHVWKCTPADFFNHYDFGQHYMAAIKNRYAYVATITSIADFTTQSVNKVKTAIESVKLDTPRHKQALAMFEDWRKHLRDNHFFYQNGKD